MKKGGFKNLDRTEELKGAKIIRKVQASSDRGRSLSSERVEADFENLEEEYEAEGRK